MGPKARAVKFYSTVSDRSEVVHMIAALFNKDRVCAEVPGVYVCSKNEPTEDQYKTIEKMARQSAKDGYFAVDITDESGKNVGSLVYEDHVEPRKVVSDLKEYFRTGLLPQKSLTSEFHSDDLKEV